MAILGIGNELRGDDAAGVLIARRLLQLSTRRRRPPAPTLRRGQQKKPGHPASPGGRGWLRIYATGPAPENFTGALRRFGPHLVLLVDAVAMGAAPGQAAIVDLQQTAAPAPGTHALPLSQLAAYLSAELSCQVALVGIQASNLEFGAPLSPAVAAAIRAITAGLKSELDRCARRRPA